MNRMTRTTIAVLLTAAMFLTMSCGIVNTLMNTSSGTAANLWPDVPVFPGAAKAKLDLPLAAKLMVQAAFQGKLEFIAYTTSKTAQEVQDYYTPDRMKATGWTTDTGGCSGSATSSSDTSVGSFCFYGKKEGGKDLALAIIAAQDDKTKQTQIFYVRIDITSTPTPKP
ncbi:MAG: hypothetical protein M1140_07825 [Chloroflexi bacterium]|nr:hypothetical protein [Chloroflexota bacterium]